MNEIEIENKNPAPIVVALRQIADLVESGNFQYKSGGLMVNFVQRTEPIPNGPIMDQEIIGREVVITSDLVLAESAILKTRVAP